MLNLDNPSNSMIYHRSFLCAGNFYGSDLLRYIAVTSGYYFSELAGWFHLCKSSVILFINRGNDLKHLVRSHLLRSGIKT